MDPIQQELTTLLNFKGDSHGNYHSVLSATIGKNGVHFDEVSWIGRQFRWLIRNTKDIKAKTVAKGITKFVEKNSQAIGEESCNLLLIKAQELSNKYNSKHVGDENPDVKKTQTKFDELITKIQESIQSNSNQAKISSNRPAAKLPTSPIPSTQNTNPIQAKETNEKPKAKNKKVLDPAVGRASKQTKQKPIPSSKTIPLGSIKNLEPGYKGKFTYFNRLANIMENKPLQKMKKNDVKDKKSPVDLKERNEIFKDGTIDQMARGMIITISRLKILHEKSDKSHYTNVINSTKDPKNFIIHLATEVEEMKAKLVKIGKSPNDQTIQQLDRSLEFLMAIVSPYI